MTDRQLTVRFIGKDAGLSRLAGGLTDEIGALGAAANKSDSQLGGLGDQADKLGRNTNKAADDVTTLADNMKTLAALGEVAAATIGDLAGAAIDNAISFEQLQKGLDNALGSAEAGAAAFENLNGFAAKTPFSLEGITESYLKLVNRGINPTNEQLRQLGDIASSQFKDMDQIVEAILDAQSGEFERLKEFGISASKEGDRVSLSFKGVNKTIENTPESIIKALLSLGDLEGVAGSMEVQSETTAGAISNLQDSFQTATAQSGEFLLAGIQPLIKGTSSLFEQFSAAPKSVQGLVTGLTGATGVIAATTAGIAQLDELSLESILPSSGDLEVLSQSLDRLTSLAQRASSIGNQDLADQIGGVRQSLGKQRARFSEILARNTELMKTNSLGARANAVALSLGEAAAGTMGVKLVQLAKNLAVLAAQAALVAVAIATISELFNKSEGAKFASGLVEETEELLKSQAVLRNTQVELQDLATATEESGRSIRDAFKRAFTNRSPFDIARASLVELQGFIDGTSKSTDRLGNSFLKRCRINVVTCGRF